MAPCEQHIHIIQSLQNGETRMQGIESKLDTVLSRQLDYIQSQSLLSNDVTRIKAVVENGLKKNVEDLALAASAVQQKIELLDDFRWFIEIVNSFRAGLMRKVLFLSAAGGVLVVFYSFLAAFGAKEFPKLLLKWLG